MVRRKRGIEKNIKIRENEKYKFRSRIFLEKPGQKTRKLMKVKRFSKRFERNCKPNIDGVACPIQNNNVKRSFLV